MNNKKYLNTFLASTVAASMVAPQIADAQTAKFNDINKSYAKQNIEYLAKKGIISGVEKNKYSPSAVMNRESFAALLGKTIKLKEKASGSSYKDVSPWAQGMVGALEEKKIVSGIGKGYFGAKMPVTREQMAVFYVRALGYEEEAIQLNLPLNYKDAKDVSEWARPLVAFAEEIGFIKGYPDGTFKPRKEALREDVAALSYRLIDPENTDPEVSGKAAKENRYVQKAKEVVKKETAPLTITSGDIAKENASKYLVKGVSKENSKLQITISYEAKDGSVAFRSKTVTSNAKGNYEKDFDLSDVPNGKVTINVGYWTTDNSTPKTVQKVVNKTSNETSGTDNPSTPGATIEKINPLNDLVIEQGGTYTLPKEVNVVYKDGKTGKQSVTWDASQVKVDTIGVYTVQGVVKGTSLKASIKVVVNAKEVSVSSIRTINPTDVTVTLNRALKSGEKLEFSFGGAVIDASKVTFNKEVVTLKVPAMNDEQIYELIVKKEGGAEIYKESIKFDLNAPTKIETVPVGYAKQVGEKVQVKYVVFDEDGDPLEGARVRIQVQYYDAVDLETKVMEEVVVSGKNGEVVYEYTSLDARRDVVYAISVDNPANVRNEKNVTVDWSLAKSGLIEVDVPQDVDKGEGNYRTYTATFKDEAGNPLPKGTKVFVYLGEQASASTVVKPGTDFEKVATNPQYAEAEIGNFEGKAVLHVTDVAGKTVKPLFYYDLKKDNQSYKEEANDPRVQAGATMFKKQVPTFKMTDKNTGKVDVNKTKTIQLEAVDQFGEPYLGVVYVGLEQALDNLNETAYGDIKFDIDINRDGDATDAGIDEFENQTGKVGINFKKLVHDTTLSENIQRSIVDLIIKDGAHLDKADVVAFTDENANGFDASDYHVKTPVEFEDVYIKDIEIAASTTNLAEGNKAYLTVSFKDQHGKEITLTDEQKADLAFQVLDEAGNVISDYDNVKNKIALEDNYETHLDKTADYAEGVDNGDTLSYELANGIDYNKFVIEFSSNHAAKYKLRVFLDDHKPVADQKKQDDEISKEIDIVVEGPVLTSAELMTSTKYSIDRTENSFTYVIRDQNRQPFKAKEDLTIEYKLSNTGSTTATVVDGSNRTHTITAGQTINFEDVIKAGQTSYAMKATPNQAGDVTLAVQAQVKNSPVTASANEITWVPVTADEVDFEADKERIYTGKVVSYKRTDGLGQGWYVLKTSVGNVKISYTVNATDKFVVDYNTDTTGLAFDEQLTVGDEISWEYDGAGKEKHTLINK